MRQPPELATELAGAIVTIDLDAVVANWRHIGRRSGADETAAVVKADAYGLGARQVVPALAAAGCKSFFVAHLAEALDLLDLIPSDGRIAVLNGLTPGAETVCAQAGVVPVLNSMGQARRWQACARTLGRPLPALLQFDSGMSRLGIGPQEARELAQDDAFRAAVPLRAVMSHLACADDPQDPANGQQLVAFRAMADLFPGVARSFANSGGCLMGGEYGADIARPGLALYGAQPANAPDPAIRPVVTLEARIMQIREVPAGAGAGYGLTWHAAAPARLATLGIGYADGWLRSLSGQGSAYAKGHKLPFAGRISMDSTIIDITSLPQGALAEGDLVELIGPHRAIEQVAEEAGTIAYEILTSLGARYARHYFPHQAQIRAEAAA
ncbi:MAG: alanine racemase [Sphingomonadales bacterium]|nr:alanine racemase [Sphingomonadales bacterium]MDE2170609.1 alanine racemase [Sphingomonadales bacterium]